MSEVNEQTNEQINVEEVKKVSENGNITVEIFKDGVLIENSWTSKDGYCVKRTYENGVVTSMVEVLPSGEKNSNIYEDGILIQSTFITATGEEVIKKVETK